MILNTIDRNFDFKLDRNDLQIQNNNVWINDKIQHKT